MIFIFFSSIWQIRHFYSSFYYIQISKSHKVNYYLQQIYQGSFMDEEIYTERVYIDPERLIKLKKQRKSLKLVPSVFEPPHQAQQDIIVNPAISWSIKSQSKVVIDKIQAEIMSKTKNSNIQFIVALLGQIKIDQMFQLQEGDCLNLKLEQRWLIIEGQLRVTGINNHSYTMQQGYFFFVNLQTRAKLKQVLCVKQSKVLRISNYTYQSYLKNYLFLKNAQKIKYLKYCPFFIWSDHLSEDIASCMVMKSFQREQIVYFTNTVASQIYFVKQGVILLERSQPLKNKFIKQYQSHYEKNEISENQTTLIVKKGMVFGIDGILLKQLQKEQQEKLIGENPQKYQNYEHKTKLNTRIYTARTIGKTELYCLKKQVLQTLFNLTDILSIQIFPKQMTKGDLQRICADYADMVVRHRSLPKITQSIIRKDLTLQNQPQSIQLQEKKINAKRMRIQQEFVKKQSIANIIPDKRAVKSHHKQSQNVDQDASILNQLNYKLSLVENKSTENHPFAFPVLNSYIKKRNIKKELDGQRYIFKWLKGEDPQRDLQSNKHSQVLRSIPRARRQIESKQKKLCLINVKSYRSIIPSLM